MPNDGDNTLLFGVSGEIDGVFLVAEVFIFIHIGINKVFLRYSVTM